MTETYEAREPVTRRGHDRPWAADLETADHATNRQRIVDEAIDAIEQTHVGQFVDLVTHTQHGHPSTYLYSELQSLDTAIRISDRGRCSCGGFVTRIRIVSPLQSEQSTTGDI